MNTKSHTSTSTPNEHKPRLGILQAGRSPEALLESYSDYNRMFEELLGEDSFEYKHWPVLDGQFPDNIHDADAWLITGSRFGAYEDHDWIPPLESLIREVYAAGSPMVGICFGHQIIAQALGGTVEKFARGWSVGRVEYELDEDIFGTLTPSNASAPALLAFHQDQVVKIPAGARNIGRNSFCEHAALIYDNRILTLQPHPEFDKAFIKGLLETRGDMLPVAIKSNAEKTLDEPLVRDPIAETLREFLLRTKRAG